MPREISAGAVVFRRAKKNCQLLLLHYGLGHWDFPKGNIEKGESEQDTVRRELAEETGIRRIVFIEGFRETIKYFYKWKNQNIFKIVIFYLVQTHQKTVKLSYEHIGYDWLPYEQAKKRLTYRNSKQVLEKAMRFLTSEGME